MRERYRNENKGCPRKDKVEGSGSDDIGVILTTEKDM